MSDLVTNPSHRCTFCPRIQIYLKKFNTKRVSPLIFFQYQRLPKFALEKLPPLIFNQCLDLSYPNLT
jgi:hypothetical protein